ncbi:TOMM precursor leader peptide-binding protein [Streptomyces sp. TP-A0874]|uniref:TOMM precursor leader peptide-binding protein n=1 Tax=Streptomyces sp. TP-A0874 TaxID=549819 RepID=UPI000852AEAF|nr:TOMM precursor leader peptide-binding protein [Streptomyces sp. TP-A0874]
MATASYEAVAATRPRIRRDVLFTETPEGVLFHNADGGFRLNAKSAYRFATLLVPHFNGEHSVAEICQGFGDGQRAMVGELVKTLYEREFARDVPAREPAEDDAAAPSPEAARRFAPQIAYIDHYADDADQRFQRFRQARVAVLGDDLVARWCVLSLIRNGCENIGLRAEVRDSGIDAEAAEAAADGCPVELRPLPAGEAGRPVGWTDLEGYDVVVVTGGPQTPGRLFPLLRAGVPEGRALLPAWSHGGNAVVGPLMEQDTAGCWACAALRLGASGDASAAADLWSGIALQQSAESGARPGRPLSAMIGNLLGYEIFRLTTGALRAETAGRLVIQDVDSLDVTSEPLLPHPRCPFCAECGERPAEPAPVDLATAGQSGPQLPTLATARDADALVEELNRRSTLVAPRAGVFTGYADESLTQIPLKVGTVLLGLGHGGRRRISAFDVHHVAGARIRALNTAAQVYTEHVAPQAVLEDAALDEARKALPALAPELLTIASGTSTGAESVAQWTTAVSLHSGERALVPAGAVRTFGPHNAERLFEATRAGSGAGQSTADAAAGGLLSALAHDALRRALRGAEVTRLPLDASAPGVADDPELTFLVRSAANLEIDVELLDLGEGDRSGVHVLLARAGDTWAVGSELGRRAAGSAALRDLLGLIQLERDEAAADTGDPLLRDIAPATLGTTAPDRAWGADEAVGWSEVLKRLEAAGRRAYLVPTGTADLATVDVHTARVLLTVEPGRGE